MFQYCRDYPSHECWSLQSKGAVKNLVEWVMLVPLSFLSDDVRD